VPLEIHVHVHIWKFGELIEGAPERCFCEHGNELSISIEMGSFLFQLNGLTVTQEGLCMKNSSHYVLGHSNKLEYIKTFLSYHCKNFYSFISVLNLHLVLSVCRSHLRWLLHLMIW
jgi:hypothetical protein